MFEALKIIIQTSVYYGTRCSLLDSLLGSLGLGGLLGSLGLGDLGLDNLGLGDLHLGGLLDGLGLGDSLGGD